ncbi:MULTISPECIES: DMT family transporter [Thauera]|uniref:Permease of the drug/metabolite transporter (DMT) superfamily n=1 Tax=Thauera aromatica K172 TaxID=44139 RepID=A0A2R4BM15_THAAR|nr:MULTISPECIES: DMT family transporter [Thauera]AVR88350.1 Permease of the drug/metabolite transporter (DMT) superfamily [Thauera aromatica K172]KIN91791.1 eamA-like transporter family protein [Thauera sp. SWB20]
MTEHATGLPDTAKGLLAALVVVICWSGFNIVSRFGSTASFTPFDLAALRYGVSGALTLPFFLKYVPLREWPRHAALALFGGLGYGLFVYSGFAFAPAAHAGVFVNGGIPFWTVIMVAALAGFHIARQTVLALVLSSAGLVLIGFQSLFTAAAPGTWIGDALFLAAALCWALFGLLMRHWRIRPQHGILGIASFSLVLYMPIYLLWLPGDIAQAGWGEIGLQAVYQGIVAALLAAGMYSYANQKIGACQASMMLALVPAFTAAGGVLILGETLGLTTMLGIVVVSLGAVLGALPSGTLARLRPFRGGRAREGAPSSAGTAPCLPDDRAAGADTQSCGK